METKHITLSYEPGRPGGPWFMSTKLTDRPKGKGDYEVLEFVRGEPGEMYFKIATKGIKFRKENPIEISLIKDQDPPGNLDYFSKPNGGGDTIKVDNSNQDSKTTNYYYKLHFDNGSELDPIIQNGCCRYPFTDTGGSMSLVADSGAINALLVAAVLIFLSAARLRWARP